MCAPLAHGRAAPPPCRVRRQQGMTWLWALLVVAGIGWGLAAVAEVWMTHAARERERELLFVGDQFRRAIASYYESTPQPMKQFPRTLGDLVEDRRFPIPRRHLRRIYADPISGSRDWGLVLTADRTIMGVYSKGRGTPFRVRLPETVTLEGDGYARWRFIHVIGGGKAAAGTGPSGASAPQTLAPQAWATPLPSDGAAEMQGAEGTPVPGPGSQRRVVREVRGRSAHRARRPHPRGDPRGAASIATEPNPPDPGRVL